MNTRTSTTAILVALSLGLSAPAALAAERASSDAQSSRFTVSDRVPQAPASTPRTDDVLGLRTARSPGSYTSYGAGRATDPITAAPRTRTINAWGANFDVPAN